jgi:hypothetical protein
MLQRTHCLIAACDRRRQLGTALGVAGGGGIDQQYLANSPDGYCGIGRCAQSIQAIFSPVVEADVRRLN